MLKLKRKRKVIQNGCSMLISLPQIWLINQGIIKGDILSFSINEQGNLEVSKNDAE